MYYARSANSLGERETLAHHLARAATLGERFLTPMGQGKTGRLLGGLHDIGKQSTLFQEVLAHMRQHVNHAWAGAAITLSRYGGDATPLDEGHAMAVAMAAHHSSLDAGVTESLKRMLAGKGKPFDKAGYEIALNDTNALTQSLRTILQEVPELNIRPNRFALTAEQPYLSWMLYTRMLFSGLVDADYSSSAEHFEPDYLQKTCLPMADMNAAEERLLALRTEKQSAGVGKKTVLNGLRDQLFDDCAAAGQGAPGIYTLTAPTGLGKTLALMAFAIAHCKKHDKRRVIVIMPYLSIIEQNAAEYRRVFPDLLESHSATANDKDDYFLTERWDAPCIITTAVGFFEPLFSDQPADCRRLHQIANSVIVLDEAQSLPAKLLDATLLTIRELCAHYGCTFVFSTATQPSYCYRSALAGWHAMEIVPDAARLYERVRRTEVIWRLREKLPLDALAREMNECSQAMAIVNTKKTARALCRAVKELRAAEEVFLVSTDLCRAHRERVIKTIRVRLSRGLPCLVIATQCIECGVDISFPTVYRALAPLEAIIQSAGRCNRNGCAPDGRVIVFLPETQYDRYPDAHYEYAAKCMLTLLARHSVDCANLAHIAEYYALLYARDQGGQALREAMERTDFAQVHRQYRLIDAHGVNVIVPWAGERELFLRLRDKIDQEGLTRTLQREARPLVVQVTLRPGDALSQVCIPIAAGRGGCPEENQTYGWYYIDSGNAGCYDDTLGLVCEEAPLQIY